ncbi:MAG: ATP-binding protein [Erysipelotrichaceae bacterium]|nr:ATP-binding protein [Erysipelotrichaceae bacterium]
MKNLFLVNYSVKGIKTLEKLVSFSFYKKTFSKRMDTQEYNIKGIYGMNGSGKSGIVASVDILKNILVNPDYLNNPMVQKNLEAMINKKTGELFIEVDFVSDYDTVLRYYRYQMNLLKNKTGKYVIANESLLTKKATSVSKKMEMVFEVVDGELKYLDNKSDSGLSELIVQKTANLLEEASLSSLFFERIYNPNVENDTIYKNGLFKGIGVLYLFGRKLNVYLEQSDDHRNYVLMNSLQTMTRVEDDNTDTNLLMNLFARMSKETLDTISIAENVVHRSRYSQFESIVKKMFEFIHIFKSDLVSIDIDRKEDKDFYRCYLLMNYGSYRVHTEYESTGIKKLIQLYAYLNEMVQGGIVFIDEFDSNLHDVYLCALLEYLMSYGEGQLCFTTHNVSPMAILKQNRKSIDFLSCDGNVTSWTSDGNYSPSKLYKNGMIDGSPFNVDSIDFIGVFGSDKEDS